MSTIGTPTPGCVPDPVNTTFSPHRLPGRNGPVWKKECAAANGAPRSMPRACQSSGVVTSSTSIASPNPT